MNLHVRKLNLIEGLIGINDAKLLSRVESFLHKEINKAIGKEVNPMTMKEYYDMIDHSLNDVRNGRIIRHDELKKEIAKWKEK